MCSVGDDGIDEETAVKFMEQKSVLKDKICNKCKEKQSVVLLRAKDCYCKECFLSGTLHKFRALLGKQRLSKLTDKILILYKTGHPSTTLLQFLRDGLDAPISKRIKFSPLVIYVEDNFHMSKEERRDILSKIKNHVNSFNFKIHFTSFSKFIVDDKFTIVENFNELSICDDDAQKISQKLIRKVKLTYRKEILDMFERNLLMKCANYLECTFAITTDLTSDVAVRLLSNVALGKGNQLPLDIGIHDDRNPTIKIFRPMRNLSMKECAVYNYFSSVEPVVIKEIKERPNDSVQGLMRHFINKLQVDYPSTVTTVLRTGDKLCIDRNIVIKCEMCKAPIHPKSERLTSAEATEFSRFLSTTTINTTKSPKARCEEAISTFQQTTPKHCFSCNVISKYLIKD